MGIKEHFNSIAYRYDYWKEKNSYYYDNVKKLYQSLILLGSKVCEIGCGTGEILASLDINLGYGIDISEKMVEKAKAKFSERINLKFEVKDIFEIKSLDYEYIVLADVLEHIDNPDLFFKRLSQIIRRGTTIIISVANPSWEPVLMFAEKLGMKMPEGHHKRLSIKRTQDIFLRNGFYITKSGYRLLVPKKLPCSDWINRKFYKIRILNKFGFIVYWILKK